MLRVAPWLFVFLWSTGWIVARAIAPFAEPLTFLSVRYALAIVVLLIFAAVFRAPWPTDGTLYAHMALSGVLAVGFYFGGVWYAVANGVPAGVSGLIAAIQPLLTALLAPWFLGERISRTQWAGIALSTIGIALVLQPKLSAVAPADLGAVWVALGLNVLGMVTFTLASIHQKRVLSSVDLRILSPLQIISGLIVTLPVMFLTETLRLEWNPVTVAAMAWSVIVLSIGATALYLMMIRAGAVSKVAALIYLVPLVVAVEAFLLFGETMTTVQMAGMVVTSIGVALAVRR
jgi:drug/metabolite transporter (DMT)-like permease